MSPQGLLQLQLPTGMSRQSQYTFPSGFHVAYTQPSYSSETQWGMSPELLMAQASFNYNPSWPAKLTLVRLAPGIPHGPYLFQFQLQPACQGGPGEACPQFPCEIWHYSSSFSWPVNNTRHLQSTKGKNLQKYSPLGWGEVVVSLDS